MRTEDVIIAIPLYNAYEYVVACLDTLDKWYPENTLVLVDDKSSDVKIRQHMEAYANLRPRKTVKVFRERRGWFTRAANTALRTAWDLGEWCWLLNSDTVIDEGALEEMIEVWKMAEAAGNKMGMVGGEGPCPPEHPRWAVKHEPGYVTGHALLLNRSIMLDNNLRFPQEEQEVRGFSALSVVHIASDRALSWQMTRLGLAPVASYWSKVGHHGGKSWGHKLASMPRSLVGLD